MPKQVKTKYLNVLVKGTDMPLPCHTSLVAFNTNNNIIVLIQKTTDLVALLVREPLTCSVSIRDGFLGIRIKNVKS